MSVTAGVLAVAVQYFTFRRLKSRETGLYAAALMAVAAWPNCSSHIAERLNLTPLASSACILTVFWASRQRKLPSWVLAGVTAGVGLWTFPAYRLMPLAAIAFIIYSAVSARGAVRVFLQGLGIYTATFLFTASIPLKCNVIKTVATFYTSSGHQPKAVQSWEQISHNLQIIAGSFHLKRLGDMSFPLSGDPLLWWPLAILATAGLIVTVVRIYRPAEFLMISWLAAGILPAVISFPEPRRLLALQPLLYGLAAIALTWTFKWLLPARRLPWLWRGVAVAALILLTAGHSFTAIFTKIAPDWKISYDDFANGEICRGYGAGF